MKIKIAIAALLGVFLVAGVAQAHKLPVGAAKNAIKQETAAICNELEGCRNWSVGPCQRKSLHRVDCVSRVTNSEGGSCAWVTIARVPSRSFEIQVHHKRIFC
jgi:hypothetical protein